MPGRRSSNSFMVRCWPTTRPCCRCAVNLVLSWNPNPATRACGQSVFSWGERAIGPYPAASGVLRMKAMILEAPGQLLQWRDVPDPVPGPGEVLVKVAACGVCRTDLHVVDGDLTEPRLPIIPGHEIVGRVETTGAGVLQFARGDRVGIPWLGHTCGSCF